MAEETTPISHPVQRARRGGARATSWWGKAWVRAAEESAFSESDLRLARALARSGQLGPITSVPGLLVVEVPEDGAVHRASVTVPVLGASATAALIETIAALPGRLQSLLAGDLPHDLVEHAEEAGVELLPFGAELGAQCDCDAWVEPCPHVLALLYQAAWLLDGDPLLLLRWRGLPRERLLAELHRLTERAEASEGDGVEAADLDVAADAVLRAARVVELLEQDPETEVRIDHLF